MRPITGFFIAVSAGTLNGVAAYNKTGQLDRLARPVIASILLGAICVAISNGTGSDIGTYLAGAVLLASVLSSGVAVMGILTAAIG